MKYFDMLATLLLSAIVCAVFTYCAIGVAVIASVERLDKCTLKC